MIHFEAASSGSLILSIGTQRVRLDAEDSVDLTDLVTGPDGTAWSQAVYRSAEGSTVRTVIAHRHGEHVTVAIGLDGTFTVARTTAANLARTMHDVTAAEAGTAR